MDEQPSNTVEPPLLEMPLNAAATARTTADILSGRDEPPFLTEEVLAAMPAWMLQAMCAERRLLFQESDLAATRAQLFVAEYQRARWMPTPNERPTGGKPVGKLFPGALKDLAAMLGIKSLPLGNSKMVVVAEGVRAFLRRQAGDAGPIDSAAFRLRGLPETISHEAHTTLKSNADYWRELVDLEQEGQLALVREGI